MDEKQTVNADCRCGKKSDRYVSFDGIDCKATPAARSDSNLKMF